MRDAFTAIVGNPMLAIVRIKNRFARQYNARESGGYRDLQLLVVYQKADGASWGFAEIQLNLRTFRAIKLAVGHARFKFARNLRAYDATVFTHIGSMSSETANRVRSGVIVDLRLDGGLRSVFLRGKLWEALRSPLCRVKRLVLAANSLDDRGIRGLAGSLNNLKNLEELDVGGSSPGVSTLIDLVTPLGTMPGFVSLVLRNSSIGLAASQALAGPLAALTSLESLSLANNKLCPAAIDALTPAFEKLRPTLRSLDLSSNLIKGREGGVALAAALRSIHGGSLEILNLQYNQLNGRGVEALCGHGLDFPSLTDLNLGNVTVEFDFGPDGAAALGAALNGSSEVRGTPLLKRINLGYNALTGEGMRALAPGLPGGLRVLRLQANKLGTAGAAALSPALNRMSRTLVELDLEYNDLNEEGFALLEKSIGGLVELTRFSLQTNPKLGCAGVSRLPFGKLLALQQLNLWNCNIGDAGCAAVVQELGRCINLELLNLRGNELGPACVDHLLAGLAGLNSLRTLNIACNPLADSWVNPKSGRRLADGLPGCDIVLLSPLEKSSDGHDIRAGRR